MWLSWLGEWRIALVIRGVAVAVALLVCSPSASSAEEGTPPQPGVAEDDAEGREGEFRDRLEELLGHHGCRAVRVWEGVLTWTRVLEYDCEGTPAVQILVWRSTEGGGYVWAASELFTLVFEELKAPEREGEHPGAVAHTPRQEQ